MSRSRRTVNGGPCKVENCGATAVKRGWCYAHYTRWKRYGDVHALKKRPAGEADRFIENVVMKYEGDDCLDWPFIRNPAGYARLSNALATRVICEKVHGPPPTPKHEAAHSCNNGHLGCVTKGHLVWKTRTENEQDKIDNGTHNRGENSAHAKLTNEQVRSIKQIVGRESDPKIAKSYGVSPTTIREIRNGKRWAWMDAQ